MPYALTQTPGPLWMSQVCTAAKTTLKNGNTRQRLLCMLCALVGCCRLQQGRVAFLFIHARQRVKVG